MMVIMAVVVEEVEEVAVVCGEWWYSSSGDERRLLMGRSHGPPKSDTLHVTRRHLGLLEDRHPPFLRVEYDFARVKHSKSGHTRAKERGKRAGEGGVCLPVTRNFRTSCY